MKNELLITNILIIFLVSLISSCSPISLQKNRIGKASMEILTKEDKEELADFRKKLDEYKNKKWQKMDEELKSVSESIKADPDNYSLYYRRGKIYYDHYEYKKAIGDFNNAISLKPDYIDALLYRGLSYSFIENYEKAMDDFNTILKKDPKSGETYIARGNCYRDMMKYKEALADYDVVAALKKKDGNLNYLYYRNMGRMYFLKEEYKKAIKYYRNAVRYDSEAISPHITMAEIYLTLAEPAQLKKEIDSVLRKDPFESVGYVYQGIYYSGFRHFDKAMLNFEKAIIIEPDATFPYYMKAGVLMEINRPEEAAMAFSKVLETDKDDPEILHYRGVAYCVAGNFEKGREDYKRVIEISPDSFYGKKSKIALELLSKGKIYRPKLKWDFKNRGN